MAAAQIPIPTAAVSGGTQGASRPDASAARPAEALAPAETALIPARPEEHGGGAIAGLLLQLPVELDVGVPIRGFRIRHLVALQPETLVESQWAPGEDLPVVSGEQQLAWSEFEVIDSQMAVRIIRLA